MNDSDIRDTKAVMNYLQDSLDNVSKRIAGLEAVTTSPQFLARKSSIVSIANSVAETTLDTETLPGKSLLTSNFIEIFALGLAINATGGAVNFTWRLKYGSASLTLGPFSLSASGSLTGRLFKLYGLLKARESSEVKQTFLAEITVGSDYNVFTTNGLLRGFTVSDVAIDSTIDQTVDFTVQHGTANADVATRLLLFKLGAPQVAS